MVEEVEAMAGFVILILQVSKHNVTMINVNYRIPSYSN